MQAPQGHRHNKWHKMDGGLKYVSCTNNGNHIWGVNDNDDIYFRKGKNDKWTKIDGKLKCVAAGGAMGQQIWGCNSSDDIYHRNGLGGNWK